MWRRSQSTLGYRCYQQSLSCFASIDRQRNATKPCAKLKSSSQTFRGKMKKDDTITALTFFPRCVVTGGACVCNFCLPCMCWIQMLQERVLLQSPLISQIFIWGCGFMQAACLGTTAQSLVDAL